MTANGLLVMSTPDKNLTNQDNPFHRHELGEREFLSLVRSRFRNVDLYFQNVWEYAEILRAGEKVSDAPVRSGCPGVKRAVFGRRVCSHRRPAPDRCPPQVQGLLHGCLVRGIDELACDPTPSQSKGVRQKETTQTLMRWPRAPTGWPAAGWAHSREYPAVSNHGGSWTAGQSMLRANRIGARRYHRPGQSDHNHRVWVARHLDRDCNTTEGFTVTLIPLAVPDLGGDEEQYVVEAMRSSWISSSGKFVERFERDFAEACQVTHAIPVSNGTVALHLAVAALGAGPGDEVIVPSLTYIATANAVRYVGSRPVFADADPATWCIDPDHVAALVSPRTVGIIAVHLYGHPADMDRLRAVADQHGLWIVEDAAEAPFAAYRGKPTGSLGDIGTFSFYGNKVITSGEGGAVTTNDAELAARMRLLRSQGRDPTRRYYFPVLGYNYRLTNVACAILCAQLERRHSFLEKRQVIADRYRDNLNDVAELANQPIASWARWTPWLASVLNLVDEAGSDRDALQRHLASVGIETRPFFMPVHLMPYLAECVSGQDVDLPRTAKLARQGINLPTNPQMSLEDVDRVVAAIRGFFHA